MAQTPQHKTANQRYKAKHLAAGLCICCPNPALEGNQLCGLCYSKKKQQEHSYHRKNRETKREKFRRTHARHKDEGRCSTCGRELDPEADKGRLTCVACINRRRLTR